MIEVYDPLDILKSWMHDDGYIYPAGSIVLADIIRELEAARRLAEAVRWTCDHETIPAQFPTLSSALYDYDKTWSDR